MFILGSPSRAYDSRYKLICKQIFSEKIGKILILIPLIISNFSFKKNLLFLTVLNFWVLEKSFIKKITTSPVIPLPIMTLILNPRQNQTMTVTLILNKSFNSNIGE